MVYSLSASPLFSLTPIVRESADSRNHFKALPILIVSRAKKAAGPTRSEMNFGVNTVAQNGNVDWR